MENRQQIDIIEISEYADAIRSTGYKDIESAISEIVDNSLEANAKNVYIIFEETIKPGESRKKITNVYFLDDGHGMNIDTLQKCLVLGSGTKKDRRGIGRFGVGLPQSSMYATPSVDIYSWQNGCDNAYMSYLDVRKLVSKEQTGFQVPTRCEIPDTIKSKYIDLDIKDHNHEFKKHGTLVVWKDCDNVNPQTFSFLKKRLEFELGRRFRYLIVNGDQRVFVINDGDYLNDNGYFELIPSDPSLLMTRNYILGNVEEPTKWYKNTGVPVFEPFTENHPNGEWIVDIDYIDRNDNTRKSYPVTIKSSVVKKEFYDQTAIPSGNPGQGELGKAIKKLQGISIVRAHREIDFGGFGFFNPNDKYTDRWWAIEIIFDPVLDEVFGVSNNKQHVELIKVEDDDADFDNDEMPKPLWTQLNESVKEEIRDMVKRNKDLRGGSRTQHDPTSSESAINAAEDTSPESVPTRSEEERGHSTEEQINEVAKDIAISKGINEEDIDDSIIATISNNKVNITYEAAGEFNPFFEYRSKHGVVQCVFNTDHELYKMFIEDMINSSDKTSKHCFELLFGSLVRLLDETTDDDTQRQYQKLVKRWNTKVEDYLEKLEG